MKKRKILWWCAGGTILMLLLVILGGQLMISHSEAEFRKFSREHQDGLAKLERDLQSRWPSLETQGRGEGSGVAAGAPAWPARPQARIDLARELTDLNDRMKPIEMLTYYGQWPFHSRTKILPIFPRDYAVIGAYTPLEASEKLRRKMIDEAVLYQGGWNRLFAERGGAASRDLPTTLSTILQPLLDRTDALLEQGDCQGLERASRTIKSDVTGNLVMMAILRANLRGERERADKMLEQAIRLNVIQEIHDAASIEPVARSGYLQTLLMALGEVDALAPEGLARVEELLRGARLGEQQLRELKAARAMGLDDYLKKQEKLKTPDGNVGFDVRLSLAFDRAVIAWRGAMLKPVVKAWAEGDEAEYARSLKALAYLNRVGSQAYGGEFFRSFDVYRCAPPDDVTGAGHSGLNRGGDTLRFIAAVARFRRAEGREPAGIENLVPRYLDRSYLPSADSCWGMVPLPPGIYPGTVVTPRPTKDEEAYMKALERFRADRGRLPRDAGELAAASPDAGAKDYGKFFRPLAARTIYFHITRRPLTKGALESFKALSGSAEERAQYDDLLGHIKPGEDRLMIPDVEMFWWEPERFRPDVLAAIKGR